MNTQGDFLLMLQLGTGLFAAIAFVVYFKSYLITVVSIATLIYDWMVCKLYSKTIGKREIFN